jgi:hypothetical protein
MIDFSDTNLLLIKITKLISGRDSLIKDWKDKIERR